MGASLFPLASSQTFFWASSYPPPFDLQSARLHNQSKRLRSEVLSAARHRQATQRKGETAVTTPPTEPVDLSSSSDLLKGPSSSSKIDEALIQNTVSFTRPLFWRRLEVVILFLIFPLPPFTGRHTGVEKRNNGHDDERLKNLLLPHLFSLMND